MSRRASGEGTIGQRADGMWYAALRIDGRRVWFRSKKRGEVVQKLRDAQVARAEGRLISTSSQSVADYLRAWLENYVAPAVEATTFTSYETNVRRIVPILGRHRLDKLRGIHLQQCYKRLLESGLSPRTVAQAHRVLRRAFNQAVSAGIIARNPCKEATPPRAENRKMNVLSAAQAQRLIAGSRDHRHHALFVLLLTSGMRVGEATGLRWQDVDLDARKTVIRQTVRREKGKGLQIAEPKTDRSRRSVFLAPGAVAALRRHRWHQKSERLKAGPAWVDEDLVFCTQTGGRLDPGHIIKSLRALLRTLDLPDQLTCHDLRHSCASILLAQNVHPKVVQELLGHSSITVTLDIYSHVVEGLHQDVARRMDELFLPEQEVS